MKNATRRGELRDRYNLVGLEVEAAGTMNRFLFSKLLSFSKWPYMSRTYVRSMFGRSTALFHHTICVDGGPLEEVTIYLLTY
jgi:hypothetical protein